MADQWKQAPIEERRTRSIEERAQLLVELLELSDALPAPARRELDAPTFRELCER